MRVEHLLLRLEDEYKGWVRQSTESEQIPFAEFLMLYMESATVADYDSESEYRAYMHAAGRLLRKPIQETRELSFAR